jgi:hypothetical protein
LFKHLAQAKADRSHQQHKAQADTKHVRQAAAQAEVNPAGEQHHIVRPRRHGGDEGKGDKGEQQVGGHGSGTHWQCCSA